MLGKHQSQVREVAPPHPSALIRVWLTPSAPFPSCLSPEFLIQQSSGFPTTSRNAAAACIPLFFFTLFCSHDFSLYPDNCQIPSRRALPGHETCSLTGHLHSSVSEEPDLVRLQVAHTSLLPPGMGFSAGLPISINGTST